MILEAEIPPAVTSSAVRSCTVAAEPEMVPADVKAPTVAVPTMPTAPAIDADIALSKLYLFVAEPRATLLSF